METLILTITVLIGFLVIAGIILKFVFKKSLREVMEDLIQYLIP